MHTDTSARAETKRPVLHGYRGVTSLVLGFVLLGATVLALSSQARHQFALSFVRQPTHYTELYFAADRPTEKISGLGVMTVSIPFTVVNHEGQTTAYPYVVQVVDRAQVAVGRAEGSVAVPDEGSSTTTVAVDVPASAPWTAVDVDLEGRPERLHLWR